VDTTGRSSSTDIDDEFDDRRHRLPSNEEDDPNASDVDQLDKEALTDLTLFWSTQLVISKQDDDEIGLGKALFVTALVRILNWYGARARQQHRYIYIRLPLHTRSCFFFGIYCSKE
jgi:hypothetical protein